MIPAYVHLCIHKVRPGRLRRAADAHDHGELASIYVYTYIYIYVYIYIYIVVYKVFSNG